jgi:DNA-binding IclR family transcriptional regulator
MLTLLGPAPEHPEVISMTLDPLPGLLDADELAGDRQFSINLSRGLEVLRAFTPVDEALSNRQLCERTGLPKATVSRLTYTLTMLGYLSRTLDQRYTLGAGVLALGYPMLASMRIRQIARPWLERLASESACTVNLAVRDRLRAVYVDSFRVDRSNRHQPDIGSPQPLLTTAIGRALVHACTPAEQTAILNRLRVHDPQRFRIERPLWDRDREAVAKRGYFLSEGESRPDVHAVAVALRQSVHPAPVAINCTLSTDRLRGDRLTRSIRGA